MKLNDEQIKAVTCQDRFIFLLAGAGSGKTATVIKKIESLINSGVNPSDILTITFTNKAAEEIKTRLNNRLENVYTFHGFCYQEIKSYLKYLNIIDPDIMPFTKSELLAISNYKNALKSSKPPLILNEYNKFLIKNKGIDFDDLLINYLNNNYVDKHKFRYIFIDEFQDTNYLQYEILKRLISIETHVFAVGDPDQSIYAFRGAKPEIINQYIKDYNATLLTLTKNYRSYKSVIKLANIVINKNYSRIKKSLIPSHEKLGQIKFVQFANVNIEIKYILNEIKELIKNGFKLEEIAIIYRNHNRASQFKRVYLNNYLSVNQPSINLLTAHESKGLEFRVVFLIGIEQNLFPLLTENKILELEEERRLFFVSITRAKEKLYITYSKKDKFGAINKPSIFIKELSPKIIEIS